MNTAIIYYSMTGRNRRLAELVCEKLKCDIIEIKEKKQRKTMTVAWDMLFVRTPKTEPSPSVLDEYDTVIVIAPVWMGAPATPVRAYLKRIKKLKKDYMFVSLSGGAEEHNPNLKRDVIYSGGEKNLHLFLDMHVSDVMEGEVTREQTQRYKLSDEQYEFFAEKAVQVIGKKEFNEE